MKTPRRPLRLLAFAVLTIAIIAAGACALIPNSPSAAYPQSKQFAGNRFQNPIVMPTRGFLEQIKLYWTVFLNKPKHTRPDRAIPILELTHEVLTAAPDNSVFRLGHSGLLLKMHGKYWLTDPVFSERASPLQWAGPKRFHAPPISIEALPPIEAVILSHDHYDHLDHATVLKLAAKTKLFIAPLGVGKLLESWGIDAKQVRELDWWASTEIDGIQFVSTPAQHFSGRTLTNRNETLWASWAILDKNFRLFYSGDTGYFDGFKTIGEKFGPFDMAFLETGAYDAQWPYVHMTPEQTLQAFQDLNAKWLFPIHNGTFDLAMHRWSEPLERITQLAAANGIALSTPVMGEQIHFLKPHAGRAWWKD